MTIVALTKLGQYGFLDGKADRRFRQNSDFEMNRRNGFVILDGGAQGGSLILRNLKFGAAMDVVSKSFIFLGS
jgi:hypothetical protein